MLSAKEAAIHLENLRQSHEFTRNLMAHVSQSRITLSVDARCGWRATFWQVADMPNETLPLPWTNKTPAATVAADIAKRFPSAKITVRV